MRHQYRTAIPANFSINKLLYHLQSEKNFVLLNSNVEEQNFTDKYAAYSWLAGIGIVEELQVKGNSFDCLGNFFEQDPDWLFGYLSYDLKNELEELNSTNPDDTGFPDFHFFRPEIVLYEDRGTIIAEYSNLLSEQEVQRKLESWFSSSVPQNLKATKAIPVHARMNKEEYLSCVRKLQQHIQRGDIYEINFCSEFYGTEKNLDPVQLYSKMNALSPMPFSAFYKMGARYAICSSPERFLAKRGEQLIAQPIKGTARRGKDLHEDEIIRTTLHDDKKEQAENVMIVDLVRNDLSRTAKRGSVRVEELFGVYTFKNLHQMISTVLSCLKPGTRFSDALRYAFPMGSMTGAPKICAMELIDRYENRKRGLYSGSIGYIKTNGDFDFNVVIRSILYSAESGYLSFMVGSAITAAAIPEREYEECLLKAESMIRALS